MLKLPINLKLQPHTPEVVRRHQLVLGMQYHLAVPRYFQNRLSPVLPPGEMALKLRVIIRCGFLKKVVLMEGRYFALQGGKMETEVK